MNTLSLSISTVALIAATGSGAVAQGVGGDNDIAYASMIWEQMTKSGLAGPDAIQSLPYNGIEPHGLMLQTFYTTATVDGHTGTLVVKRNYGPEGVSADAVLADPAAHLGAVTVMFQRAEGYDPETGNWFWVKYLPDGTLDTNPAGVPLAGLIGKGADAGCIACHSDAGDDMMFTTDAYAPSN